MTKIKMPHSGSRATKDIYSILGDLEKTINILRNDFSFTNINNTKLGRLKKEISDNISNPNQRQLADANRYGRVWKLLSNNELQIEKETLKRLIKGHFDGEYANDRSDDIFFELDFALRLNKATGITPILDSRTDIILPNKYAFECKKISSKFQLQRNINEAVKQLTDRYIENDCPVGIVVLDLSSILNRDLIEEEFISKFEFFKKQYSAIESDVNIRNLLVYEDDNFQRIIGLFANAILEFTFRGGFKKQELPFNIAGIFYQAEFFILYQGKPKFFRVATYFINESIMISSEDVSLFFRKLETGI